jgi:hypothetical protein
MMMIMVLRSNWIIYARASDAEERRIGHWLRMASTLPRFYFLVIDVAVPSFARGTDLPSMYISEESPSASPLLLSRDQLPLSKIPIKSPHLC